MAEEKKPAGRRIAKLRLSGELVKKLLCLPAECQVKVRAPDGYDIQNQTVPIFVVDPSLQPVPDGAEPPFITGVWVEEDGKVVFKGFQNATG
jgi:hypothetical protein